MGAAGATAAIAMLLPYGRNQGMAKMAGEGHEEDKSVMECSLMNAQ